MFKWLRKSKKDSVKETNVFETQSAEAKYRLVAGMSTDPGCVRDSNEDSGGYHQPLDSESLSHRGSLFVVADGMGGHSAGEVASRIAVECITRAYYENSGDPQSALKDAFAEANRRIYETAQQDERLAGMGTTCTALALQNGSAISAHVGDSRLYLVREENIYLMTEDHSAVMEMVKRGWLSLEQARHHPDKNVILRAMGSHPEVEVTTWQEPFPVRAGDKFLLCSDGLYDLVEDEEMCREVTMNDPNTACERLVALARERGGHDNITVLIVNLKAPEDVYHRPVPVTRVVEVEQ